MTASTYHPKFWRPWQVEFLQQHFADYETAVLAQVLGMSVGRVRGKATDLGLKKRPEVLAEIARARNLEPGHGFKATQFKPGLVPANKGKKFPGVQRGNMAATQFKPGNKPPGWRPVGTYTVIDGEVLQKVNELPGPKTLRWKPVRLLVWEAVHGPAPAGHAVTFKPGRRTLDPERITLDALELVTRAELMARNSIANIPAPLREVMHLSAKLRRQIDKRQKEQTP